MSCVIHSLLVNHFWNTQKQKNIDSCKYISFMSFLVEFVSFQKNPQVKNIQTPIINTVSSTESLLFGNNAKSSYMGVFRDS